MVWERTRVPRWRFDSVRCRLDTCTLADSAGQNSACWSDHRPGTHLSSAVDISAWNRIVDHRRIQGARGVHHNFARRVFRKGTCAAACLPPTLSACMHATPAGKAQTRPFEGLCTSSCSLLPDMPTCPCAVTQLPAGQFAKAAPACAEPRPAHQFKSNHRPSMVSRSLSAFSPSSEVPPSHHRLCKQAPCCRAACPCLTLRRMKTDPDCVLGTRHEAPFQHAPP